MSTKPLNNLTGTDGQADSLNSMNIVIKHHLYGKYSWELDQERDELDISAEPRFYSRCDFQAEDEYDLDGHFWSEHDDEENAPLGKG